jgi:hypothetical protein
MVEKKPQEAALKGEDQRERFYNKEAKQTKFVPHCLCALCDFMVEKKPQEAALKGEDQRERFYNKEVKETKFVPH